MPISCLRFTVLSVVGTFAIIVPASAGITATDLYTLGLPSGSTGAPANVYPNTHQLAAGGQVVLNTTGNGHAVLWNGNGTPIILDSAAVGSVVYSVGGGQQVGYGSGALTNGLLHALLWNGTNAVTDLNPTGVLYSEALGVGGGKQVGRGVGEATLFQTHALLWSGTNTAVDLHPNGFGSSEALGVADGQQVGNGVRTNQTAYHALLWNGTNIAVDLHPDGFTESYARGVGGGQQVGHGANGSAGYHALLWAGSNAAIDLNPPGFIGSTAEGVSGGYQVGYGGGVATGNAAHALLWQGSAAGYVDLHSVLPGPFTSSYAYSIAGTTVYGLAYDANGAAHAIAWTVPEPGAIGVSAMTAGAALVRRRVRRA